MGSYAITANVMTFKLQDFADLTYRTMINPDFIFKISRIDTYNASYNGFIYSVIGFRLVMKRRSLKYVLNYYVPSLLFVSASWTSFMVPPRIVPGRMALLITLLLVLINFYGTIIENQPACWKTTNIMEWIICCTMFVFGALVAYSILLYKLYVKRRPDGYDEKSSKEKKCV